MLELELVLELVIEWLLNDNSSFLNSPTTAWYQLLRLDTATIYYAKHTPYSSSGT